MDRADIEKLVAGVGLSAFGAIITYVLRLVKRIENISYIVVGADGNKGLSDKVEMLDKAREDHAEKLARLEERVHIRTRDD